jgi:putative SOS response-associated peptidase YedK
MMKGQQAVSEAALAMTDRTGNSPSLPRIYSDYAAPIVGNSAGGRELAMAHWGCRPPAFTLKRTPTRGIANVRNTSSAHWRGRAGWPTAA